MGTEMTKNFEISEYVEPVASTDNRNNRRGLFRQRLENMPVGKAIVVTGMAHGTAASRASLIGSQMTPKRKFSTANIGDGRIQISRIA